MKIKDTRDGRILEGAHVATIEAGAQPTSAQLFKWYGVRPHDRNFALYAMPVSYDRVVLDRGDKEDPHYYIVPMHGSFEQVKEA